MNLIEDKWIPVRRKSGKKEKIAPWQVTENMSGDPIVGLAAVRPDFNGALVQFLIGLLQTTCAPKNNKEWRMWRDNPPKPEELKRKFEGVTFAFNLDGDGPRFMQDLTLEKEERKTVEDVEKLLIDAPGEQTLKFNTDHFIKRRRIEKLCLFCVAQALFTLQTNAPSGGKGHRVGLRGGGPVVTIILEDSLWETIWSNVLDLGGFEKLANKDKTDDKDRFPWLAKTRTSDNDRATTAQDINPAQIYWSMPRRVRLISDKGKDRCDLCNELDIVVTQYLTKPYGVMYKNILHPLTPLYRDAKNELFPMHQHENIGYKYWLGYVQAVSDGKRQTAEIINQIIRRGVSGFHLWAFGYDMDNMKASCWYEGIMPVVTVEDENKRRTYEAEIASMIRAADSLAVSLRYGIKDALFNDSQKTDINKFGFVAQRFWQETESDFYQFIAKLREDVMTGKDGSAVKQEWHKRIVRKAEEIFDEVSQSEMIDEVNVKRVAQARQKFLGSIWGKKVRQEILGLPQ